MHSRKIMHRDLKPDNILLTKSDFSATLKLIDFGLSKKIENFDNIRLNHSMGVGTPIYMSPEVLSKNSDYDYQVDLWSLGLVLFEMLFGKNIYEECTNLEDLLNYQ